MNIYRYLDYREITDKLLKIKKNDDPKINATQMAQALGIQKTYISRVFRKNAHFNTDQLYLACQFLGLDANEQKYLFLLLEYERTVVTTRRQELLGQIRIIQSEATKIEKHLRAKMIDVESSEKFLEYYLDAMIPLVHVFFNIPEYRRYPEKIQLALGLTETKFNQIVSVLEKYSIIKMNPHHKAYDLLLDHIHLPKESPLSFPYEQLSRFSVIDHLKKLSKSQRFYYSFHFSADEKTRSFIHQEILKFLAKTEAEIKVAPSEKVYYMSFDLFPWKTDDSFWSQASEQPWAIPFN